jgi:hypothetical protein
VGREPPTIADRTMLLDRNIIVAGRYPFDRVYSRKPPFA